jgi:hypothetical protein
MVRFLQLGLRAASASRTGGLARVEAEDGRHGNAMLYVIRNFNCRAENERNTALLVKEGLGAQVYQHLRHDLMVGRYEPGQKLKLRDLAGTLGTSVTPVS